MNHVNSMNTHNSHLKIAIDKLKQVQTPNEARLCLNELFSPYNGSILFSSNTLSISPHELLEFTHAYKNAISLEAKETFPRNKDHDIQRNIKKHKRLTAIRAIESFVQSISSSNEEVYDKRRYALQMLGRVREGGLVHQRSMGLFGIFSILRDAWSVDLCKMAEIGIGLLSGKDGAVVLDNVTSGCKKTFKLPKKHIASDHAESYIDSLMIAAVRGDAKPRTSTSVQYDALIAANLGIPFKLKKTEDHFDDFTTDQFNTMLLDDLCQASRHKISISSSVNADTCSFLKTFPENFKRKKPEVIFDIDLLLQKHRNNDGSRWHIVQLDNIEKKIINGKKVMQFKLYTWGETKRIQMR